MAGLQVAGAADDITEGDWDDWGDNPGQPEAYFVSVPEADYSELHLQLTSADEGASILWTFSSSLTPDNEEGWNVYSGPIYLTEDCTVRYFATLGEGIRSEVKAFTFTYSEHQVPAPYAKFENLELTIGCQDQEAEIWYTFDSEATPGDSGYWTLYTLPLALEDDCTLRFFSRRACFNDSDIATYVFERAAHQVSTPAIKHTKDGTTIVMGCMTEGAEIHYTTDGTEPTRESELYTEPVYLTGNFTYKAKAFADGLFDSAVCEYSVTNMKLTSPYAVFSEKRLTLITSDAEAKVFYTTAEDPVTSDASIWTEYTHPIELDGDCTVCFFASRDHFHDSDVAIFEFVYSEYQTAAPEFEFDEYGRFVTISCVSEGAEIHYTTDGTEPTPDSELYTGPIEAVSGMTITARAFADGLFDSEIVKYEMPVITGVDTMTPGDVRISVEGGQLLVCSDKALRLPIYSLDGKLIRIIEVNEGHAVAEGLQKGIYIILGIKVKI